MAENGDRQTDREIDEREREKERVRAHAVRGKNKVGGISSLACVARPTPA